jgi:hypothetical protein
MSTGKSATSPLTAVHSFDISNGHDALVDVSAAFGTSGHDVERELRA